VTWVLWVAVLIAGTGLIVWGAERFAENLSKAATRLGVGAFALALLLAGAEPEELATVVAASVRGSPAIAFGDIIGSNIAICLVALPIGALVAGSLGFSRRVFMYALAALPVSALSVALVWDGELSRIEGLVLVALYGGYVAAIWAFERAPPLLGEVEELVEAKAEARETAAVGLMQSRVGVELVIVIAGLMAMAVGSVLLVEAVRQITDAEDTQTKLGLTVVGFATSFELVMLVFSASRRGATDVALAGVVGSFGYNMTMSLGVGALVNPLEITEARALHVPAMVMLAAFGGIMASAALTGSLSRRAAVALLFAYPVFVLAVAIS
jgi:cation:H+ antiporter